MSAEKLKGCRSLPREKSSIHEGVVDHSTKIPGGGSTDPIPLKSVSAGKSHLNEGVSGQATPIPPKVGVTATTSLPVSLKPPKLQYDPGVSGQSPVPPKVGDCEPPVILNTTANLDALPAPRLSPKACTPKYVVYQCGCGRHIVPSTCMSLDCIVCQPHVGRRRSESVFRRLTASHNHTVIYSVFTTPLDVRQYYYDKTSWQKVRRKIWRFLKKSFGAQFGVEVSHPVGDSDANLFHPHLNFLWVQKPGWSPFIDVEMLRKGWAKILEVDNADVYTQYSGNLPMVKHWTNYVCRTFPGMHTWTGPLRWYGRYPILRKPPVELCAECGLPYSIVGTMSAFIVDNWASNPKTFGTDPPWLDDSNIMHCKSRIPKSTTRNQHGRNT